MNSLFIYISDNARVYFYSTLLQADVTLISIFGLFIVFKVQVFQTLAGNFRSDLYKEASNNLNDRMDAFNFDYSPQKERDRVINEEILSDGEKINQPTGWDKFNLLINDKFSEFLMKKARLPMLLFLIGILWNVAGLVFLNDLNHERTNKTIEVVLIYIAALYQTGILIYVAYIIHKYILQDRWKKDVSLIEDRKLRDIKNRAKNLRSTMKPE